MDSWRIFCPDGSLPPTIVGHRGDPARFPDNTLAGIMSGLASTGAVEVDVRLTADGRLVLSHGLYLRDAEVHRTAWLDLAEVDLGGGHSPCQLDDILALPGCFDLEVKNWPLEEGFDPHGRLALMVASRVRSEDVVTSFYWPDMDLVRSRAPTVATGLLVDAGGSAIEAVRHAVDNGHGLIAAHHTLVDDGLCDVADEEGLAVAAWTVNDVEQARKLSLFGVAAIISDQPTSIRSALQEEAP